MSIADKLQTIYENGQRVYDAGFEAGKALSGDSWYDTFWNAYQENGSRYHWNNAFSNRCWTDTTYNPKYAISDIQYAYAMYQNAAISDTKFPLDFTGLGSAASYVFDYCASLHTIRELTVNESLTFLNWFRSCTKLENITFKGTIGNSLSFAQSNLLTNESVASIISALMTITDGVERTLTLHADVKSSLTDEQLTTITTTKGWTLA